MRYHIIFFSMIFAIVFSYAQGLKDPAQMGPYKTISHSYTPQSQNPNNPLRTDISQYFNSPDHRVKEKMNNVPISGVGHYPEGTGPFPVVLIFHGNHHPLHPSHEGYGYLTK